MVQLQKWRRQTLKEYLALNRKKWSASSQAEDSSFTYKSFVYYKVKRTEYYGDGGRKAFPAVGFRLI